jgi:chemotaxis protein CheD
MHSEELPLVEIVLAPGEYFVGDARHRISTLLGSCVSITLWHPRFQIGAMSHFLLPRRTGPATGELDGRYGEEALCLMLRKLAAVHVEGRECVAKIFGGGNMFPSQGRAGAKHVGVKNGEAARALLRARRIPVVSESLFGVGHRRIIFDVRNGDVWARQADIVGAPDGLTQ